MADDNVENGDEARDGVSVHVSISIAVLLTRDLLTRDLSWCAWPGGRRSPTTVSPEPCKPDVLFAGSPVQAGGKEVK